MQKKALLIGVNLNDEYFEEALKELKGLAKANNIKVVGTITQNLKTPQKKFFVGPGKIDVIKAAITESDANLLIFNNELTPLQFKNLQDELKIEIIDRTMLILQIFKDRAKSKEAKLQVEVATLNYMLPRLISKEENYSQQTGGVSKTRGKGEKQIDIDKKILRNKISFLEKELDDLEKNKLNSSKKRIKSDIPSVAIVGYTNAGKSTLLNAFIEEFSQKDGKEVFTKNMLFATLDTTVRHIKLKDNKEFLLSDTVGFISSLPTGLIRAFKSTLNEVINADLILIVSDISSMNVFEHLRVTEDTLIEIGVNDIPVIYVFNKADKLGLATIPSDDNKVFISAKNRLNLNLLVKKIKEILFSDWITCKMFIPYEESSIVSYLQENATIISIKHEEKGSMLQVELKEKDYKKYNEYVWVDNSN